MTNSIFGTRDHPRMVGDPHHDRLQWLWHKLSAQHEGTSEEEPNNGLTQRKCEIHMLWSLYLMSKPKIVLEVGCSQGGTAAGWLQLGRDDMTFIALDRCLDDSRPRPGDPVHRDIYNGPLKMYSEGGGIHHLKGPSQTIIGINGWTYEESTKAQLTEALSGRKIDWCFHDASHQHERAWEDFQWLWPLIEDGGCFCSHDIQPCHDERSNKEPAWRRAVETWDYSALFEFKGARTDSAFGLGVIIK